MSSCRTRRPRLAPSASRTASSRCRAAARDSSRFATFAQAISSTAPTTPPSSSATDRICCRWPGERLVHAHDGDAWRSRPWRQLQARAEEIGNHRIELGAGLLDGGAGLQAADAEDPAVARVLQQVRVLLAGIPGARRAHDRLHHHRHVERPRAADLRPGESGRRDADDREDVAVEADLAADDVRLAAETCLPELVADDRHRMRARRLVVDAREQPSAGRLDAEHVEEVAGDDEAAHELRRIAGVEAGGDAAPARQRLERRRMVAQRCVLRIGEDSARARGSA